MNFEDIQTEYKLFFEHLYAAQGYMEWFFKNGNKFLQDYSKSKLCDKNFAEKLDEELLKLAVIYKNIDDTIDLLSDISIGEMEYSEQNNILNFDDYIKIPDDYDMDIYVDLNHPICLKL